jgi:hypothetical protein
MGGVRLAQERATEALIAKLDHGLNDRLETLLQARPDPSTYHVLLAHVYNGSPPPLPPYPPGAIPERASVIARVDYLKRECPDVFFVQNTAPGPLDYPLNFAANPVNLNGGNVFDYVLPLGAGGVSPYNGPGAGIYGASYPAAAAFTKNLGYLATGYDGIDNTGEGLIDEWQEGVSTANQAAVLANLAAHQHKTARAEALYALLVEGSATFGAVFSRDEFTDKEVRDTDGDGLPEFVDAWGEPLQFYRWPLLFHSELQRGQAYSGGQFTAPYQNMVEEREQDPLDTNQTLMAPAWWAAAGNDPKGTGYQPPFPTAFSSGPATGPLANSSAGVMAFEFFFHSLHEPLTVPASISVWGLFWDRSVGPAPSLYTQRRAFYQNPLIVSWGPDKLPGIFGYYPELNLSLPSGAITASLLIWNENPAPQFDPMNFPTITYLTDQLQEQGQDDIRSHALPAGGN